METSYLGEVRTTPRVHDLHSISSPWHKEQEYKWFWVGILTVFKIFELFLFEGFRIPDAHDLQTFFSVFKIFGHFLFEELEGVRAILKALDINTIWCTLTQETTIHMIWGSGFQLFWGTVGLQISGHFCSRRFYLRTDFLYIFCLIYPEYRLPNPDVLFLPKNTV